MQKIFKVPQSHPWASEKPFYHIEILKGHGDSIHWNVMEHNQGGQTGNQHDIKPLIPGKIR
jgi:hypothetical protein